MHLSLGLPVRNHDIFFGCEETTVRCDLTAEALSLFLSLPPHYLIICCLHTLRLFPRLCHQRHRLLSFHTSPLPVFLTSQPSPSCSRVLSIHIYQPLIISESGEGGIGDSGGKWMCQIILPLSST